MFEVIRATDEGRTVQRFEREPDARLAYDLEAARLPSGGVAELKGPGVYAVVFGGEPPYD